MNEKAKAECKTCGDTGQIGEEEFRHGRSVGWRECPDCKQPEFTTIDNKSLWARNFLTSLMYEPKQEECIRQRIKHVIDIIDCQAAELEKPKRKFIPAFVKTADDKPLSDEQIRKLREFLPDDLEAENKWLKKVKREYERCKADCRPAAEIKRSIRAEAENEKLKKTIQDVCDLINNKGHVSKWKILNRLSKP